MGFFDILFGSSMTDNYIGRHGEFDRNDEDRDICEDMFAMRSRNHDADLEAHYGWENKMNYDCDGYADEEDW